MMDRSRSVTRAILIAIIFLNGWLMPLTSLRCDEPAARAEQAEAYWLTTAARHENKFGVYSFSLVGQQGQRLVVGDHPVVEPHWSPDGRYLAYVVFEKGPGQICVMDSRTQEVRKLTNSTDWERNPTWSPDGSRIAFTSRRDNGIEEIYVMDPDGSNVTNLTNHEGIDADPAWSPDGKRIAFASQRDGRAFRLFVMNSDGTEQQPLSDRQTIGWLYPDWSPNGKWILVGQYEQGDVKLCLFSVEDGSFKEVASEKGCNSFARWSPDGRYFAYGHFESPPRSYRPGQEIETLTIGDLMLYDGDFGTVTVLGKGMLPGWGPRPCWQLKTDLPRASP